MRETEKALFNEKQCRESAAKPRSNGYVTTLSEPLILSTYLIFHIFFSPLLFYVFSVTLLRSVTTAVSLTLVSFLSSYASLSFVKSRSAHTHNIITIIVN